MIRWLTTEYSEEHVRWLMKMCLPDTLSLLSTRTSKKPTDKNRIDTIWVLTVSDFDDIAVIYK